MTPNPQPDRDGQYIVTPRFRSRQGSGELANASVTGSGGKNSRGSTVTVTLAEVKERIYINLLYALTRSQAGLREGQQAAGSGLPVPHDHQMMMLQHSFHARIIQTKEEDLSLLVSEPQPEHARKPVDKKHGA